MSAGEPNGQGSEQPRSPSSVRPGARYSFFVGLAFLGLIAVAAINAARTDEGTLLGTEEIRGEPLPEFAVPDIRGSLDADANIAQDDCETSRNPCPPDDRRDPACEIDPEGAIRVCDLFDKPLVLSFWFTNPSDCPPTQDRIYELAGEYEGRVNFLSIAIRGDREDVEREVSERGWDVDVGWDRDGAVSNIYRVGLCPTVAVAREGGIFEEAFTGAGANPAALRRSLRNLLGGKA